MATRRIAIIGGTIWGNRGAEAMVTTAIGLLHRRWPDAEFSVFSYLPRQDERLIHRPWVKVVDARPLALVLVMLPAALACWLVARLGMRLPDAVLPRSIRNLRDSSVLLDVFGISFTDGREVFLPFNVLSLAPAFLLGVPVIKLSQAMGPFHNRLNRLAAKLTLGHCAMVFARGEETAGHLAELGLPDLRWATASDIAFLYEPGFSLSAENVDRVSLLERELREIRQRGGRIVAICPSSVVYKKATKRHVEYVPLLADIATRVVRQGHHVLVLPHATREGSLTLRNNDLPVLDMLKRTCGRLMTETEMSNVLWANFDISSAGIRQTIQHADLVLTSRFHAMIAALSLGIPPLAIGWSHKYREVLSSFDLEHAGFDIETLESAKLIDRLTWMMDADFRAHWNHVAALQFTRAQAERQFLAIAPEEADSGPHSM